MTVGLPGRNTWKTPGNRGQDTSHPYPQRLWKPFRWMRSFKNFRGSEIELGKETAVRRMGKWHSVCAQQRGLGKGESGRGVAQCGWSKARWYSDEGECRRRMCQHQVQMTPQRHFSEKEERSAVIGRGIRATKAFKRPWRSIIL